MNDRRRNTVRIDYDKLAEAIVKAELQVNDELEEKEIAKQKQIIKEWQKTLGYDENAKGIKAFGNDLKQLWKIVTLKREDAKTLSANNTLLKLALVGVYRLFELALYLLIALSIALAVHYKSLWTICLAIFMLIIGFLLARITRAARFEVDNTEDNNYLATLFSAVMSFVAVIVSSATIVVSIIIKR